DGNACTIDGCDPSSGVYHNIPAEICGNNIDDNCDGQIDEGCQITLNIKVFIEGFYMNGTMQPVLYNAGVSNDASIADEITVVLHQDVFPFDIDTTMPAVLDVNGNTTITLPYDKAGHSYYIAIVHRNSIETWSKLPVTLGNNTLFDFTN